MICLELTIYSGFKIELVKIVELFRCEAVSMRLGGDTW
jgi:hypothetical protein